MFFFIEWCDGSDVFECVTKNERSAYQIFWALKKLMETYDPPMDCWIIVSTARSFLDPTKGMAPIEQGQDYRIIIKKAREDY